MAPVRLDEVDYFLGNFKYQLESNPYSIWSDSVSEKTQLAMKDFLSRQKVSGAGGDLTYGQSVRDYSLEKKTFSEIQNHFLELGCDQVDDVLKEPERNLPIRDQKGDLVPMIVFCCQDGGAVRVKIHGDPTSKFRPQPHSSKALRYPAGSPFQTFDDEVLKVDNQGLPIPKWARDLKKLDNPELNSKWVQGWADDAHTDLPIH